MANMIAFDEHHQELIFPIENTQLRSGDLVLIKSGEQVPADCKILWGNASVNEAILTGESLPAGKKIKRQSDWWQPDRRWDCESPGDSRS